LLVAGNGVICRLMPDGTSWQVAGARGAGFTDDGGPALSANLKGPSGLTVGRDGSIFFADTNNNRIRRLQRDNPGGYIALVPAIHAVLGAGSSYRAPAQLSPGGLSSIFGTDFARSDIAVAVQTGDVVFQSLPTKLANTCVEVSGVRGFLTFVSSRQINFQVPSVPPNTEVTVQVIANCGTVDEVRSSVQTASTRAATPEFLYWTNNGDQPKPVVAVNAITGAYIGAPGLIPGLTFVPAKSGDLLTIYCISMGSTNPAVTPGLIPSQAAALTSTPQIYIGNKLAEVLYAGVTPGIAGLYQINVRVPALPDGDQQILMGDAPSEGFVTVSAK